MNLFIGDPASSFLETKDSAARKMMVNSGLRHKFIGHQTVLFLY